MFKIRFRKVERKVDLDEMARVGSFDKFDIFVRTNDSGKIPHFHIVDSNTMGDNFHSCVKILSPEYFVHEGKEDKLNSDQRKDLVKFLSKNSDEIEPFNKFSNWLILVFMWNKNNSDVKVNPTIDMPDYTKLK